MLCAVITILYKRTSIFINVERFILFK
jgi:hypothetical protein